MASKADDGGVRRVISWRMVGWGIAGILIPLPLVAMQFTAEVNWTASDFVFAAVVFGVIGGTFELAVRKSENAAYRCGAAVALATAFLLVWINAAVGIIGNEDNPANLMFFGVIAIPAAGAILGRFEAPAMALAMTVAAAAETAVGAIVFVMRLGANEPPGLAGVLILIECFAVTWLISAWLFRKAAAAPAKML